MATVSIPLGSGAGRLWVAVDATGVTLWNGPFWQQRLTDDEARRLVEVIVAGLKRRP
ncbi:MAG: hypothetical protein O2895_04800 [Chloroflexi bacterium]|nr:hypothetical protein [Chloroflexota bacterium]